MKGEEGEEFKMNLFSNQSLENLRNNRTTAETDCANGILKTGFLIVLLERKK